MKYQLLCLGVTLALGMTTSALATTETVGISNVEYHTVDEILTMYH